MKVVILAGGLGTRLYPLTHATNKHLLPVFNKPMIHYPIRTLVDAGVTEIVIVIGGPHAGDFIRVLRNGENLGVSHFEYAYQESGEGGIADALKICEDFAGKEPLTVILGDNCTDSNISKDVKAFKGGAMVFLQEVSDPERFGVPVFDNSKKKIIKIEEKPKKPKSNLVILPLYVFKPEIFSSLKNTSKGHNKDLQITDAIMTLINNGGKVISYNYGTRKWFDIGLPSHYFNALKYSYKQSSVSK